MTPAQRRTLERLKQGERLNVLHMGGRLFWGDTGKGPSDATANVLLEMGFVEWTTRGYEITPAGIAALETT